MYVVEDHVDVFLKVSGGLVRVPEGGVDCVICIHCELCVVGDREVVYINVE